MRNEITQLEPDIKVLRAKARDRLPDDCSTGVSTTGDVNMLVLEAEMQANGRELDNPHIPTTTDVLAQAKDELEAAGLEPAWSE